MSEESKRAKKLSKDLKTSPGKVIINVLDGSAGPMTFNPQDLPEKVQAELPAFGLGHKLGDAAAGKSGTEAEESIKKVWDGLMAGDWSVRAPAAQKISVNELGKNLANLSPQEQEAARAALAALGITLP